MTDISNIVELPTPVQKPGRNASFGRLPLQPLAPLLVTQPQAAQILGTSRQMVKALIRDGALETVKLGHRVERITIKSLDEVVRQRAQRRQAVPGTPPHVA